MSSGNSVSDKGFFSDDRPSNKRLHRPSMLVQVTALTGIRIHKTVEKGRVLVVRKDISHRQLKHSMK